MNKEHSRFRAGVTMVEVLVCIGVVLLLLGLLLPAIQRVREASTRTACLSQLRQIGVALHHYHADAGRLPPRPFQRGRDPDFRLNWLALILSYIEQDPLWAKSVEACRLDLATYQNPPHVGFTTIIRLYVCPDDPRLLTTQFDQDVRLNASYTSYLGVAGGYIQDGVLGRMTGVRFSDVTDGTSNTLMVGERPPPDRFNAGWWYTGVVPNYEPFTHGPDGAWPVASIWVWPADSNSCGRLATEYGPGRTDNPCDRYHYWSFHPGGANFLFVDGAARFLPYSAQPLMAKLGSCNGGEVVDLSQFVD